MTTPPIDFQNSESGVRYAIVEPVCYRQLADERSKFLAPYASLFAVNRVADFSVGPGWWGPLEAAFQAMQQLQADAPGYVVRVSHAKEKFGRLRLDASVRPAGESRPGVDAPMDVIVRLGGIVAAAERACVDRCELCGDPGTLVGTSWIQTLCEKHAQQKREWQSRQN